MLVKIDIKAGEMTFAQRIELGKIFSSNNSEIVKFEKVFTCLHDFQPRFPEYEELTPYFQEIVNGLVHWVQLEQTTLIYEPTISEEANLSNRLNVKKTDLINSTKKTQFTLNVIDNLTVQTLADNYKVDTKTVLNWKYKDVYKILRADCIKGNNRNKITMCN